MKNQVLRETALVLTLLCLIYPCRVRAQSKPVNRASALHGVAGANIEIVHFVLGGIRDLSGKSSSHDVLAVAPTQGGGIRGFPGPVSPSNVHSLQDSPYNGAFAGPLDPSNEGGFATFGGVGTGLFPPESTLPRGGGYRGGGYRGQKNLPITQGGYRGVPPAGSHPKDRRLPNALHRPHNANSEVKDIPFDQVVVLPSAGQQPRPDRGSRFSGSWTPEFVVDLPQVVREDKVRPPAGVKPQPAISTAFQTFGDSGGALLVKPPIHPGDQLLNTNSGTNRPTRPPLVPVTSGGPPTRDHIAQLEAELVAGLTPQQLEELSSQAIDPRTVEGRSLKSRVVFPGKVV